MRSFCLDQFLCMAFAQISGRRSLRDLEIALHVYRSKLYDISIRSGMARNTLAHANEVRGRRIWQDSGQTWASVPTGSCQLLNTRPCDGARSAIASPRPGTVI